MNKKHIGTALRLLVSFGAIGIIIYMMREKLGDAAHILQNDVLWRWFVVSLGAYFVANAALAARLMVVFKTQELEVPYLQCLYLAFLGLFFNLFLPSAIGGDVAKIYYASKSTGRKIAAASAVIQDRLVGFMMLMVMALIALFIAGKEFEDHRIHQLVYLFVGIMCFTALFFANKAFASMFKAFQFLIPTQKLKDKLRELYHAMSGFQKHTGLFLGSLGFSFMAQTFFVCVYYFLAVSLNVSISFWLFFIIVPVISIVSMMPSLGGLGVREAGFIFFMKNYMSDEKALVISVLLFVIVYGVSLISGIVYAFRGGGQMQWSPEMEVANSQ